MPHGLRNDISLYLSMKFVSTYGSEQENSQHHSSATARNTREERNRLNQMRKNLNCQAAGTAKVDYNKINQ